MELKRLVTATLADALRGMEVGESCLAPEGYERGTVVRTCSTLRREGYRFSTTTKPGVQVITRLG